LEVRVAKRAGEAGHGELTVVGGSAPKSRTPSKRDFTKAKQREFLSVLSETCNVRMAAREAGVSITHAYHRRKTDAAFRAAWREAIGAAYQRLELVLLERAFNGTEKLVKRRDGSEERMREYSDRLGLTLLKMHRDSAVEAAEEPSESDIAELRERLVEKLERLRKRFEAEETR
jgi:hypothetical protein